MGLKKYRSFIDHHQRYCPVYYVHVIGTERRDLARPNSSISMEAIDGT
jgi:hypothetical protein